MTRYAQPFGVFHIDTLPNQPQIAHCHSFFVDQSRRGEGLAHILKQHQAKALADSHFDFATCTVDGENQAQKRVLVRAGWEKLTEFKNSRTGGMTELWGCEVVK